MMKTASVETPESSSVKTATAMEASAEPAAVKPCTSAVETTASAVATAMLGKTEFWYEADRKGHCSYGEQPKKEGAGHGSVSPTYLDSRPERVRRGGDYGRGGPHDAILYRRRPFAPDKMQALSPVSEHCPASSLGGSAQETTET